MIILNYNTAEDTIRLAEACSKYSIINLIVIVDNNSPDNSFELLQAIKSEKIDVIKSEHNGGYGKGNMFGILYAQEKIKPDIIVVSNPDIFIEEDAFNASIKCFDTYPNLAAAAPMMRNPDSNEITPTAWKLPTLWSEFTSFSILLFKLFWKTGWMHYYTEEHFKKTASVVDCIIGAFVALDTQKFLEVGGFDTDFFLYSEESVLGFKFKEKGYISIVLPEFKYIHYQGVSTKKAGIQQKKSRELFYKSKLLYLKKYRKISKLSQLFFAFLYFLLQVEFFLFFKLNNFRKKANLK